MAGKRKSHSAAFKAQVALAAVKGDKTINELASQYGVHPTLIHAWKKQLLAGAEAVFASGVKTTGPPEDKTAELFEQIGRLKVELDWVKKIGSSVDRCKFKRNRPGTRRPVPGSDRACRSLRRSPGSGPGSAASTGSLPT